MELSMARLVLLLFAWLECILLSIISDTITHLTSRKNGYTVTNSWLIFTLSAYRRLTRVMKYLFWTSLAIRWYVGGDHIFCSQEDGVIPTIQDNSPFIHVLDDFCEGGTLRAHHWDGSTYHLHGNRRDTGKQLSDWWVWVITLYME